MNLFNFCTLMFKCSEAFTSVCLCLDFDFERTYCLQIASVIFHHLNCSVNLAEHGVQPPFYSQIKLVVIIRFPDYGQRVSNLSFPTVILFEKCCWQPQNISCSVSSLIQFISFFHIFMSQSPKFDGQINRGLGPYVIYTIHFEKISKKYKTFISFSKRYMINWIFQNSI